MDVMCVYCVRFVSHGILQDNLGVFEFQEVKEYSSTGGDIAYSKHINPELDRLTSLPPAVVQVGMLQHRYSVGRGAMARCFLFSGNWKWRE